MNLFTPNLQFTLNAAGSSLPNPGAFLKTSAVGDYLQTNVTYTATNSRLSGTSFVFVTRPIANEQLQPFIALYDGSGSDVFPTTLIGKTNDNGSSSHRYGVAEQVSGGTSAYYGHNTAPSAGGDGSATYGNWHMIAGGFDGNNFNDWEISKLDGLDPSTNKGGTNSANVIDDVEGFDISLGWPGVTYPNSNNFELAMVRIYNNTTRLTDEQSVQIWDHWASKNAAYYENNGQTLPSYNKGVEDYTTDLLAEWDFAKMPPGVIQTTGGSVGTVTGSLIGNAVVTV